MTVIRLLYNLNYGLDIPSTAVEPQEEARLFFFPRLSRLTLGRQRPTNPSVQRTVSLGITQPVGEAHHSPTFSVEISSVERYTSTPIKCGKGRRLIKQRDVIISTSDTTVQALWQCLVIQLTFCGT